MAFIRTIDSLHKIHSTFNTFMKFDRQPITTFEGWEDVVRDSNKYL